MTRVLVVDDTRTEGFAAVLDLERAGIHAEHEQHALEVVRRISNGERWDVLVLDVQQPDLSGDQLAANILEYLPEARILLHSSLPITELFALSLRAGVPYCPKGGPLAECVLDLVDGQSGLRCA